MISSSLSVAIETAIRNAFTELVARSAKETIYSFALYSDEDAVTLCPAANTLEYLEAEADKDDWAYYQFEPAEWRYEMEGADEAFNAISKQLWQMAKEGNKQDTEIRGQQLKETCIYILAGLKEEGFFRAVAGHDVFLLYTVSDSDIAPAVMEPVISRLNDAPYRQQYLEWMKTWDE